MRFHPHLHHPWAHCPGSCPSPRMPREPQQQDQKGTSSFQLVSLIRRRRSLQNNHQTIRDGTTESTRGEGALKAASAGAERCGAGMGQSGAGTAGPRMAEPATPKGAGSSLPGREKKGKGTRACCQDSWIHLLLTPGASLWHSWVCSAVPPGEGNASSRPRNRNHRLDMAEIT